MSENDAAPKEKGKAPGGRLFRILERTEDEGKTKVKEKLKV